MASIKIACKKRYDSENGTVSGSVTVLPKNESFSWASCITKSQLHLLLIPMGYWRMQMFFIHRVFSVQQTSFHVRKTRVRKLPLRNARPQCEPN